MAITKKKTKTAVKKSVKVKTAAKKTAPAKAGQQKKEIQKYFEAVGRRKSSTARARIFTSGKKGILINDKHYKEYFPLVFLQKKIEEPLEKLKIQEKFGAIIKVRGGGISSQAEACRHGISRALVLLNPYFKKKLRKAGFLTRDPRKRERKKFGLKRARKAPQWSKR